MSRGGSGRSVVVLFLMSAAVGACGASSPAGTTGAVDFLFAGDIAYQKIAMLPTAVPAAGASLSTKLLSVSGALGYTMAYDPTRDVLFTTVDGQLAEYAHASRLGPGATPVRSSPPVGMNWLYLDRGNDVLYAAAGDGIGVYPLAALFAGGGGPSRRIQVSELGFAIDTMRGVVYTFDNIVGVHVFDHADTADGPLQQTRAFGMFATGLALDTARDRLYIADALTNGVHIVDNASTTNLVLNVPTVSVPHPQFVTLDEANDRLYVGAYDSAYLLPHASTLTDGPLPADAVAVVTPAGSSIAGFAFP